MKKEIKPGSDFPNAVTGCQIIPKRYHWGIFKECDPDFCPHNTYSVKKVVEVAISDMRSREENKEGKQ